MDKVRCMISSHKSPQQAELHWATDVARLPEFGQCALPLGPMSSQSDAQWPRVIALRFVGI
jgi:hypothetical protein